MPYICHNPERYEGEVVGTGSCAVFVQQAAGAPLVSEWREGEKVRGKNIQKGTAIATFVNGQYLNLSTGNHAAIYVSQTEAGLVVWDQWKGQPAHQRTIRFKSGAGSASNDGDRFAVIELSVTPSPV